MFKHILVPVDGSSTARQAIDKALAIAEAFKSTVTLVYVIGPALLVRWFYVAERFTGAAIKIGGASCRERVLASV